MKSQWINSRRKKKRLLEGLSPSFKEPQARQDRQERLEHQARQDRQERLGTREPRARQDFKALRDRKAPQDRQVVKARPDRLEGIGE